MFDVDGALADGRHRLHHVEPARRRTGTPSSGRRCDDPPLAEGVALAQASAEDCDVVYVTGRPERCRANTLTWFRRHGLPLGRAAHARRPRPAARRALAKPGLLRRLAGDLAGGGRADDDVQVCDAYEAAGYRVAARRLDDRVTGPRSGRRRTRVANRDRHLPAQPGRPRARTARVRGTCPPLTATADAPVERPAAGRGAARAVVERPGRPTAGAAGATAVDAVIDLADPEAGPAADEQRRA